MNIPIEPLEFYTGLGFSKMKTIIYRKYCIRPQNSIQMILTILLLNHVCSSNIPDKV